LSAVESQFFFEISWRSRARPLIPRPGILVGDRKRSEVYEEVVGIVHGGVNNNSDNLFVNDSVALVHGTLANMTMF
jgi:hypothetical protein